MRAALMLTTGNRDQINLAANDLQALVTKSPQNHLYHFNLARALVAKGEVEPARLQLEEAIKIRSDFVLAREMLAKLYMSQGQSAKALKGGRRRDRARSEQSAGAPDAVRSAAGDGR